MRGLAVGVTALAAAGCDYVIVEPNVERVEITAPRLTIGVGDSLQLQATPYFAGDRARASGKVSVGWASSAPAVAVVNPSTGVVTGIAPGRATIRATARARQDTVTVTVIASALP